MIGQAGHETGWGRSEIKNTDGSASFNLFGIKAGPGWTGKVASVTTTEYINGEPKKSLPNFALTAPMKSPFKDYARLINEVPAMHRPSCKRGRRTPTPAACNVRAMRPIRNMPPS